MACDFPACECMCHPDKCIFKEENRLGLVLLDRDCVILDGHCDCPRIEGKLPDCRKYGH